MRSRTPAARTASVRSGRRRRPRARPALEGPEVGVRRDRPDRAALPPPRLRGAAHEAGRGPDRRLRDLPARGHHRHQRVPRRRRQPASVAVLRPKRARACSNACCERRRRSSGSASTPVARSAASTGSGSRSATSCRSCSRRTTSPRRRACGARSIPSGRMNPQKVLPDGARCGDFAVAASGTDAAGIGDAAHAIPEGTWI